MYKFRLNVVQIIGIILVVTVMLVQLIDREMNRMIFDERAFRFSMLLIGIGIIFLRLYLRGDVDSEVVLKKTPKLFQKAYSEFHSIFLLSGLLLLSFTLSVNLAGNFFKPEITIIYRILREMVLGILILVTLLWIMFRKSPSIIRSYKFQIDFTVLLGVIILTISMVGKLELNFIFGELITIVESIGLSFVFLRFSGGRHPDVKGNLRGYKKFIIKLLRNMYFIFLISGLWFFCFVSFMVLAFRFTSGGITSVFYTLLISVPLLILITTIPLTFLYFILFIILGGIGGSAKIQEKLIESDRSIYRQKYVPKTGNFYKIIILGDNDEEKNKLQSKFINPNSYQNQSKTIGASISSLDLSSNNHTSPNITLQFWNINAKEMYEGMREKYIRGGWACIIVFDVNSRKSFNSLKFWIEEFWQNSQKGIMPIVVIGTKIELRESDEQKNLVSVQEAKEYTDRISQNIGIEVPYIEISTINNIGKKEIHKFFNEIHSLISLIVNFTFDDRKQIQLASLLYNQVKENEKPANIKDMIYYLEHHAKEINEKLNLN